MEEDAFDVESIRPKSPSGDSSPSKEDNNCCGSNEGDEWELDGEMQAKPRWPVVPVRLGKHSGFSELQQDCTHAELANELSPPPHVNKAARTARRLAEKAAQKAEKAAKKAAERAERAARKADSKSASRHSQQPGLIKGTSEEDACTAMDETRAAHPTPAVDHRQDIDGLRAIAVIAVIIYHMEHAWLPGGFTGVDIFFVISGYVVCGSLVRTQHESLSGFLAAFYARRAKRLLPALAAMVLVVALCMSFLLNPDVSTNLPDYYASAAFALVGFAANHFAGRPDGYFDDGPEALEFNPFTHTWSLGVEEQFYFIFPMLVAVGYGERVVRSKPIADKAGCCSRIVLFSSTGAISLMLCTFLTSYKQTWAFYLLPSRFWELMSGAALFDWQERRASALTGFIQRRPLVVNIVELAALLSTVICFMCASADLGFPVPWALPAVFAALLFIGAGAIPSAASRCNGRVPTPLLNACIGCAPMAYIGRISYPLYLWHWPVFVLCKWTVGFAETSIRAAAILVTVALAMLSYHGLEKGIRNWRPKSLATIFGAALAVVLVLEAFLIAAQGPLHGQLYLAGDRPPPPEPPSPIRPPPMSPVPAPPPLSPSPYSPPPLPAIPLGAPFMPPPPPISPPPHTPPANPPPGQCACSSKIGSQLAIRVPASETVDDSSTPCYDPSGWRREFPGTYKEVMKTEHPAGRKPGRPLLPWWPWHCWLEGHGRDFNEFDKYLIDRCLVPQSADGVRDEVAPNQTALLLIGDSHAAAMMAGIERAVKGHMAFAFVGKGHCAYGVPKQHCTLDLDSNWRQWNAYVTSTLQRQLRPGDVVAIASVDNEHEVEGSIQYYEATLIPILRRTGARLVLFGDWGKTTQSLGACTPSKWNPSAARRCEMPLGTRFGANSQLGSRDVAGIAFAARHPGIVHHMSVGRLFCSDTTCGATIPGTNDLAYADNDHISNVASLYFWPHVCSQFSSWGLF